MEVRREFVISVAMSKIGTGKFGIWVGNQQCVVFFRSTLVG